MTHTLTSTPDISILYVEDEPEARELVVSALAHKISTLRLYIAENGEAGLALYRKHRPDIVITDIKMPLTDGIRMGNEIKLLNPEAIIIAVTAHSDTRYLLDAIETGISNYVLKPIDYDKLFEAIAKGIETVTMKRRIQEQNNYIRNMAYYDALTGLPNRRLLLDRLNHALAQARRYQRSMALLFLDLDNFKHVNDTMGHDIGDELLKVVAGRLQACVRVIDTVCRQGGDEFIIVLTEIAHPQGVAVVANKIIEVISEPISLQEKELRITTSIGIAVYSVAGTDDEKELMKKADRAMYEAKYKGGNGFMFYHSECPRVLPP